MRREPPVASPLLDIAEKQRAYARHTLWLTDISTHKACVDTSHPPVVPRLVQHQKRQARQRQLQMKADEENLHRVIEVRRIKKENATTPRKKESARDSGTLWSDKLRECEVQLSIAAKARPGTPARLVFPEQRKASARPATSQSARPNRVFKDNGMTVIDDGPRAGRDKPKLVYGFDKGRTAKGDVSPRRKEEKSGTLPSLSGARDTKREKEKKEREREKNRKAQKKGLFDDEFETESKKSNKSEEKRRVDDSDKASKKSGKSHGMKSDDFDDDFDKASKKSSKSQKKSDDFDDDFEKASKKSGKSQKKSDDFDDDFDKASKKRSKSQKKSDDFDDDFENAS